MLVASCLVATGVFGIFIVTIVYPLSLLLRAKGVFAVSPPDPIEWPSVTIVTAARNAAALLPAKLNNFSALHYPPERLTLLIASDASTDATREVVESAADPRIRLIEQEERRGKAAVLNLAVEQTDTELLLFSDADALLTPDAVRKLARHFANPQVGGVCGQRLAAHSGAPLRAAQQTYINLDSQLRRWESMHGCISSNDGKIHMIRRSLFEPIPRDVSDDLYTGLSVVAQGFRFLFEPDAVAEVNVPSRDARHEIQRRRRIVLLSLTGIFRMRCLLNPLRFGWFAAGLWINKIGRRLLPFFLLALAAGIFRMLAPLPDVLAALLVLGVGVLLISQHAQYALAGFAGTAWGVIDFLLGRRMNSWEPKKTSGDTP